MCNLRNVMAKNIALLGPCNLDAGTKQKILRFDLSYLEVLFEKLEGIVTLNLLYIFQPPLINMAYLLAGSWLKVIISGNEMNAFAN